MSAELERAELERLEAALAELACYEDGSWLGAPEMGRFRCCAARVDGDLRAFWVGEAPKGHPLPVRDSFAGPVVGVVSIIDWGVRFYPNPLSGDRRA
jgi:hypothetical protein